MPIYEYLCADCNRIFSFLVRRADDPRLPRCPRCRSEGMRKQLSRFAVQRQAQGQSAESGGAAAGAPLDDPRIEREMLRLMQDAERMDEHDPRQLGQLMRRMSEVSGEGFDPAMEEAVRRLEAGEDAERIEEDLGDALDGSGSLSATSGPAAPSYDEGLYEL
jgi:putative FmdB family regulatory protein